MKTKITDIEKMPQVISAQHIADYLGIARKTVYELFQTPPTQGGITNFSVGTSRKVVKEDFMQWILDRKKVQENVIYARFGNVPQRGEVKHG